MKNDPQLSKAGAEIVGALEGFLSALEEGGDISERFTVRTVELKLEPSTCTSEDLLRIRLMLGLSQALFAKFIGSSTKALQSWEAGRRSIPGVLCRFLDEIETTPEHWKARVNDLIVSKGRQVSDRKKRSEPSACGN